MATKDDIVPDVRKLLSQGKTQQEIADELNVSRSTIQRVMPLIKSEIEYFEPMTFIEAKQMNDQGSPSVVLPLRSFMAMVDKSLPILYPANWNGRGEVKQYQQNVIIRWSPYSVYPDLMSHDFEKWFNYMEKYEYEDDGFIRSYIHHASQYIRMAANQIAIHVAENEVSWFGRSTRNIRGVSRDKIVEFYIQKLGSHLPEEEEKIFQRLEQLSFNPDSAVFYQILTQNPDPNKLNFPKFLSEVMENPVREILTKIAKVPEDLVDHMIKLKKYNIQELKLMLDGGFKTEGDVKFAKAGGFQTMKEVRKARKFMCQNKKELQQVLDYGWEDGNAMRNAIAKGFKGSEYELYAKTIQENDHIGWNKTEIAWARTQTDTTLKRLSEFSSIRALDFCDFLLDVQEPVYRTDRLMQEHNKLTSPGRKISSENKFEEFLDEFPQYVEVTAGGLTKILLNSDKTLKVEPRISPVDFPSLKSLKTNLAKDLKRALKQNNLNEATTDAYAFMKYQLNKHIEAEDGEDLMVVDEVSNLLNLNKQSIKSLHQARLARNWVSHKESEQKIAPRWKYVEITLTYAQQLSEIEN
tara:strand:- start:129 stop:1865 length:1737 start_codon:yes stop_codon:yes gene_type:complete